MAQLQKPQISVIITCFNSEKTIENAIQSVLNQKEVDLEIIIVDDGSSDNSFPIISKLAKADKRLISLKKPHGFPSAGSARNVGVKKSSADFLFFMDSDDELPENALKILLEKQHDFDSDFVVGTFAGCSENGLIFKRLFPHFTTVKPTFDDYMMSMVLPNTPLTMITNKLISRKLFLGLSFRENAIYSDLDIIYKLVYRARTISYSNDTTYLYFINPNGMANKPFSKSHYSILPIFMELYRFVAQHSANPETTDAVFKYFKQFILLSLVRFFSSNKRLFFAFCHRIQRAYFECLFKKEKMPLWFAYPMTHFFFFKVQNKIKEKQDKTLLKYNPRIFKCPKTNYQKIRTKVSKGSVFFRLYSLKKIKRMEIFENASISSSAIIDSTVSFPDGIKNIKICDEAVIRKNSRIFSGVKIEADGKTLGAPCIGNNVSIGADSVLSGGVTIRENSNILPNSSINDDFPDLQIS